MSRSQANGGRLLLGTLLLVGTATTLAAQTDSTGFNWWFPPQSSTSAAEIDAEIMLIFWITAVAFLAVMLALGGIVWRYRFREGRAASAVAGNARLELIWGGILLAILLFLAFNSQAVWGGLKGEKPKNPDLIVEVRPRQFQWDVRYAGRDKLFGTPDDITAINQITVPLGKQVLVRLQAQDVIHSFFVPEFRMKQDAVPGMETNFWFRATRLAKLEVVCAELCGLGHGVMRGILTVMPPDSFDVWYQKKMEEKQKQQGGKIAGMLRSPFVLSLPNTGSAWVESNLLLRQPSPLVLSLSKYERRRLPQRWRKHHQAAQHQQEANLAATLFQNGGSL
ncbi:MAG: cytochrome c oxidase subunit II [Chlorobi bacterium]|nr:cytochrome c oxidase subunit II [Chlorobiota bacterium]